MRLAAEVSYDTAPRGQETLWFEVPASHGDDLSRSGNPWTAALLPVAATLGEDLEVAAPVDARLLEGAERVLRIWADWYACTSIVALRAGESSESEAANRGRAGAFFSGGIDSFHTALTRRPLDELIFVGGLDLPLAAHEAIEDVRRSLALAAGKLGLPLVFVRTNWRETRAREVDWELVGHGALLASIALALEGRYGQVFIPTSGWTEDRWPWGSDPRTDPLLSTRGLAIRHDGQHLDRHERGAVVAASDLARAHLRVCWRSADGTNCGHCAKCRLTMLMLEILVGLDRCPSFPPGGLPLEVIRRMRIDAPWDARRLLAYRDLALRDGRTCLARAVGRALGRSAHASRWRSRIRRLRRRRSLGPLLRPLRGLLCSGLVPAPKRWPSWLEGTDYPGGRSVRTHAPSRRES